MTDIDTLIKRMRKECETSIERPDDADILALCNTIESYREWIVSEAEISDACTLNILGKICDGCRCGKVKNE